MKSNQEGMVKRKFTVYSFFVISPTVSDFDDYSLKQKVALFIRKSLPLTLKTRFR